MSDNNRDFLSDDKAARRWKRAAELQEEAAREAEATAEPEEEGVEEPSSSDGYALAHVRQAAVEAGIESEYVDEALVELGAERVLPAPSGGLLDRVGRWWLDDPVDNIEVSRVVSAPVVTVLASMEKLFPRKPFELVLKDQHGDPRRGGVLVFDIEKANFVAPEGWTGQVVS